MVVVVMDGRRGSSTAGTPAVGVTVARLPWKDAGRTPVAALWLNVVDCAGPGCCSDFLPGSKFIACWPMTILPDVAVKIGNRLMPFWSPLATASHGSQTLYDGPNSDSL